MYELEHQAEAERLEGQALQKNYSLKEELQFFQPKMNQKILDAGCGSGLLCKYLALQFPDKNLSITGFDFSETRVRQARENLKNITSANIQIVQNNLEKINHPDNDFDVIICRFVIEHLHDPMQVLSEFKRILKPGGMIYLIDLDGVWVNLHSKNKKLNLMMSIVEQDLNVDFKVGRKLSTMISQLDFTDIEWDITHHVFKGDELIKEYENNKARCEILKPRLVSIFETESEASYFIEHFLDEIKNPATPLFHNKFIVRGIKKDNDN